MSAHSELDQELERRLTAIETEEYDNPIHAKLSGGSLMKFMTVVTVITVAAWVVASL